MCSTWVKQREQVMVKDWHCHSGVSRVIVPAADVAPLRLLTVQRTWTFTCTGNLSMIGGWIPFIIIHQATWMKIQDSNQDPLQRTVQLKARCTESWIAYFQRTPIFLIHWKFILFDFVCHVSQLVCNRKIHQACLFYIYFYSVNSLLAGFPTFSNDNKSNLKLNITS